MYVVLYVPEGAEPEVFGPYSTFQHALNILRAIAEEAGFHLEVPATGLVAGVSLSIDGELHHYQLLKMASADQLQIHVELIGELAKTGSVQMVQAGDVSPPGSLSSY